jgi:hypothetical protein
MEHRLSDYYFTNHYDLTQHRMRYNIYNDEWIRLWGETVVIYFKVLSLNSV